MSTVNVYTALDIKPYKLGCSNKSQAMVLNFTKGATIIVGFELNDRIYTMDELRQVVFMLYQGRRVQFAFSLFNDGKINNGQDHTWEVRDDEIVLTLQPEITRQFKPTEQGDNYVLFEVAVELVSGETFVEKMPNIYIKDSLLSKMI